MNALREPVIQIHSIIGQPPNVKTIHSNHLDYSAKDDVFWIEVPH